MRTLAFLISVALLGACRRSVEVTGLYANAPATYPEAPPPLISGTGQFLPCTQPGVVWWVSDSALAKRYQVVATHPSELLFARFRGVRVDSGSIYWSSQHLVVQDVLELRQRKGGECPNVGDTLAHALRSQ